MKFIKVALGFLIIIIMNSYVSFGAFEDISASYETFEEPSMECGALFLEPVCLGKDPDYSPLPKNALFFSARTTEEKSLEDYIVERAINFEENIPISSYNLTIDELKPIFYDICLRHSEIMSMTGFHYYESDGIVTRFTPYYLFDTKEETDIARTKLQEKIDEYVSYSQSAPDIVGKILLAHDKIAYNYSYEKDYANYDDYFHFHPYGFLLRGKAVCQGYTSLFYGVLEKLGVDADFCYATIDGVEHIWNYVKLDNKWYHIDLTWDDKTLYTDDTYSTLTNTVFHTYFLRSDDDFSSSHGDSSLYTGTIYTCDSKKFEKNYVFSFPYATTITFDDGFYNIPYGNITFSSPKIMSGQILSTKLYEETVTVSGVSTPSVRQIFFCTGEMGENYKCFVTRKKGKTISFASISIFGHSFASLPAFPKSNDGSTLTYIYINMDNLEPLSTNHSIIDE